MMKQGVQPATGAVPAQEGCSPLRAPSALPGVFIFSREASDSRLVCQACVLGAVSLELIFLLLLLLCFSYQLTSVQIPG